MEGKGFVLLLPISSRMLKPHGVQNTADRDIPRNPAQHGSPSPHPRGTDRGRLGLRYWRLAQARARVERSPSRSKTTAQNFREPRKRARAVPDPSRLGAVG